MQKSLFLAALMSMSPAVFSQEYNGTVNDLNTIFDPPAEIQGTLCAHTKNDGNEHSGDVCRDGVSAARWMAEKYAKKAGKYLGCVDGFYQGMWDGYLLGKNPSIEMIKEAESYLSQATMKTALQRGDKRASESAVTESADEIIRRYRDVLRLKENGQQVLPNKQPDLSRIPEFNGFDGGYEYDLTHNNIEGGNFDGAIKDGYVTNSSSFEDKLAARKAYYLQGQHAKSLCDVNQTIFGRKGLPQLTIWDFFKARRQYDFQQYGWKNGSWAWDIYNNEEQTMAQYQNFVGIQNLEKDVVIKTPITEKRLKLDQAGNPILIVDAAGNPVLDGQGRKQYEMEEIIIDYKIETKRVKLDSNDIKNLRNTYQTAFVEAYNRYYAKQYASIEYHVEGLAKYDHAKTIGQMIGEDVAINLTKKKAYDDKYKAESRSAYDKQAEKLYLASFYNLLGVFENNPVVELNEIYVDGTNKDNIYRRGEQLTAEFSVTNLGEVTAPVTVRLDNTMGVIADQAGYTFSPAPIARSNYKTGMIGQVSNDARLRDTVTASMTVENPSFLNEVSRELVVNKKGGLVVRDYAEIERVNTDLRLLDGSLDVKVDIINPSSVESPAMPKVKIVLHNMGVEVEKEMLKIAAGNTNSSTLNISGLDPINLIEKGKIKGTVYVALGNNDKKLIDKRDFELTASGDASLAYAKYFDSLVSGKISNTGSVGKSQRIGELVGKIDKSMSNVLETTTIKWKKQHEVNRTIIGDLQDQYRTSKAAGFIDSNAQAEYDKLAELLAKKVNNKGKSRIRGLDKHYLKALQVFSPGLSTKWRDHKN